MGVATKGGKGGGKKGGRDSFVSIAWGRMDEARTKPLSPGLLE